MEVSFAVGGAPADVQAKAQSIIGQAVGDSADGKLLGAGVATYIGSLLAGVPKGQTAALRVHVSIGVTSPAQELAEPAPAATPAA